MIDEHSLDGGGWARFSDDARMRYRLARALRPARLVVPADGRVRLAGVAIAVRAVFLMLNPSTADAFKPDRTVSRCAEFARRWGADILEVVNLFAFISPYPSDLYHLEAGARGDDHLNDGEILGACADARFVVAAWGNDGALGDRATVVRAELERAGAHLVGLGRTGSGQPMHPLARGKNFIPYDRPLAPL